MKIRFTISFSKYFSYLRKGLVLYAVLFCFSLLRIEAQPVPALEYKVKAVFLFNFTQFVDWPKGALPAEDYPYIIGVLGENPFGTFLQETVSGEKKGGHPIEVRYYRNIEEIHSCHILFINSEFKQPIPVVLSGIRQKGVLTVSDSPDFIKQGGMIRFYTHDGKIRMQINPEAAKATGLTISSKLLRLSDVYLP